MTVPAVQSVSPLQIKAAASGFTYKSMCPCLTLGILGIVCYDNPTIPSYRLVRVRIYERLNTRCRNPRNTISIATIERKEFIILPHNSLRQTPYFRTGKLVVPSTLKYHHSVLDMVTLGEYLAFISQQHCGVNLAPSPMNAYGP